MIVMKTTKSPFKSGNSIALVIPDFIVKAKDITEKKRLTIELTSYGFKVKVRA